MWLYVMVEAMCKESGSGWSMRYRGQYQIIMHILLKQSVTAYSAEVQTGLMLEIVCLSWSMRIYGVCE